MKTHRLTLANRVRGVPDQLNENEKEREKEKMMRKYILAVVGSIFFSSSAFAAGYGDAGCGLGSMMLGDTPGATQIFAATTNGSTWTNAFGISSGTSNCDASGIVLAEKEQEIFVAANFSSLAKEMAAGEGEQLITLAGLLGCPPDKGTQLGSFTQRNYEAILPSGNTTPVEMLRTVKEGMAGDPVLSAACIR